MTTMAGSSQVSHLKRKEEGSGKRGERKGGGPKRVSLSQHQLRRFDPLPSPCRSDPSTFPHS